MTEWDDKYKQHPVHTTLSNLQDTLDNEALASEDVSVISTVDRIRQSVEYTAVSLQNVIPAIFHSKILNNIDSYLQSINSEVNSYISNKNAGHLNNTAAHVDNLTTQIASLAIPRPKLAEKSFTSSAITFKKQIESIVEEMAESKNELLTQVTEIANTSAVEKSKLDEINKLIEQHQRQIVESIDSFQEKFEIFETDNKNKLSQYLEKKK